ncbi:MAG: nuclease A inhibitor family protein [Rivularia sp. (in: cyanobacteria)]
MKSHNAELLANLKSFTQGLVFSDDERGSLNPFVWDVSEKGKLTAEKLMLSNKIWGTKSLTRLTFDVFLEKASEDKQTKALFKILQSHLTNIEIYQAYFPDDVFNVYIGKTREEDWFGLCSPFESGDKDYSGGTSEKFIVKNVSPSQAILNLLKELQNNYLPLTNQYAKYQRKWMRQYADTKDKLIEKLMDSVKFFTTQEYKSMLNVAARYNNELAYVESETEYISRHNSETSYFDEETGIEYEIEMEPTIEFEYSPGTDYSELDDFLKSTLSNLRVYTIGANSNSDFHIYVLGNTQGGDWAGVLIDVKLNRS